MNKLNKCPPPTEGPYCQQGILIHEEAQRQLDILDDLAISEPNLGTGGQTLKQVEDAIAIAVAFNWARCLPDWSGMVHLNPTVLDPETGYATYEPWSADLFKIRLSIETGVRVLTAAQSAADAYTGGRAADIPGGKSRRKPAVVVIDDTDHPGPIH